MTHERGRYRWSISASDKKYKVGKYKVKLGDVVGFVKAGRMIGVRIHTGNVFYVRTEQCQELLQAFQSVQDEFYIGYRAHKDYNDAAELLG